MWNGGYERFITEGRTSLLLSGKTKEENGDRKYKKRGLSQRRITKDNQEGTQ